MHENILAPLVSDLAVVQIQNELVVDSRLVAESLGVKHKNFIESITKTEGRRAAMQSYSKLAFKTEDDPDSKSTNPEQFFWLNEKQCNHAMGLARNTPQKEAALEKLIWAFDAAKQIAIAALANQKKSNEQAVLDFCAQLEARRWNMEFTPEFYAHIQRLAKLSAPRSSRVAQLTKELVYDKLPTGLYDRLASYRTTDPQQKLHQFLTENGGLPAFRDHMQMLLILMRSSSDLDDLRARINASTYGQYQLRLCVG
jgi:phage regulator Rha-like protein